MKAQLLCAGLGTRFRPQTEKIAKPCLPFLNVPLMGYGLSLLEQAGLSQLVINTHHLPKNVESVTECLAHPPTRPKGLSYNVNFTFEPKILGSGGGIKNAEKYLRGAADENFLVINGDEVFFFKHNDGLKPLLDFHKKSGALATLLTTAHPAAGKTLGGVWAGADGKITRLGGTHSDPGAQHFTGAFVFSSRVFDFMPKHKDASHIFEDCLSVAMVRGEKVLAFHDPDLLWLDTSGEKDYIASVARILVEMKNDTAFGKAALAVMSRFGQPVERVGEAQWLGAGAEFNGVLEPGSFLVMGAKSFVASGVDVKGFGVLGADSRFEQGLIESSVVGHGLHVHEMVSLRKQLLIG
jgi:NDP-sugar pyrophosphorylase family protein